MPIAAVGVAAVPIGAAAEIGTTTAMVAAVGATISAVGSGAHIKPLGDGPRLGLGAAVERPPLPCGAVGQSWQAIWARWSTFHLHILPGI
jgi:hypothetical protein